MTRTMHFNGIALCVHPVVVHCALSLQRRNRPLRPYPVIAIKAKSFFSHKQTAPLDKGAKEHDVFI